MSNGRLGLQTFDCDVDPAAAVAAAALWIGGKYVLSCIVRAAINSSSFLLHSAPLLLPDDGFTYPDPVFLHFTDGQPLIFYVWLLHIFVRLNRAELVALFWNISGFLDYFILEIFN